MVLAKDRRHSTVLLVEAVTYDLRLMASSEFFPSTLLHVDYVLSLYLNRSVFMYLAILY
jgi:hypothetical protein